MYAALSVPKVTVAAYPALQQLGDLDPALEHLPPLTLSQCFATSRTIWALFTHYSKSLLAPYTSRRFLTKIESNAWIIMSEDVYR